MRGPVFSLFLEGERILILFSLVLKVFQWVPQVHRLFPQDIPNSTSDLYHMVYPKFNFCVYNKALPMHQLRQ
jgi:hypothetical protein